MSSPSAYQFSSVISGHSADVRCLVTFENGLVSGSRDLEVAVWNPSPAWSQVIKFQKHDRYISALAVSNDLIITGTVGGRIRIFSPGHREPLYDEEAHAKCVSALYVSKNGTVLSGSWDHTAKVWLLNGNSLKAVMTLQGHENSVWAVAVAPPLMITGSADKSIKFWKAGQCVFTIEQAHSQAIRDIQLFGQDHFISTGNDGDVKWWKINGETAVMLRSIRAHEHFVYSLTVIDPEREMWALSGENSGLKIFRADEHVQTLNIPAISAWKAVTLPNRDVAVGSSDGNIWIFSNNPERVAAQDMMSLYETELSKFQRPAKTELDGIDVNQLPGPNALLEPGKRDGQTKMVKDGQIISVHSWSVSDQKWTKIGDVVGQPDDQKSNGNGSDSISTTANGKSVYNGVEYDYVFNIELDGGLKLKLPYNKTEDPWMAAQKFIHQHDNLTQDHLETIARFIIANSDQSGPKASSGGVWDPLTGSGAYTTNGDTNSMEVDCPNEENVYFPADSFLSFQQAPNMTKLINKLKEFNAETDEELKVKDEDLDRMANLVNPEVESSPQDLINLMKMLGWPDNKAFPALDVLRLTVLNERVASNFMFKDDSIIDKLLSLLLANLSGKVSDNCQLLAVRTLCNLFKTNRGLALLSPRLETIWPRVMQLLPKENKNVQIAISTLALNFSVAFRSLPDSTAEAQLITSIGMVLLETMTDSEAKFRCLVSLGTLLSGNAANRALAKDFIQAAMLDLIKSSDPVEKNRKTAAFLLKAL